MCVCASMLFNHECIDSIHNEMCLISTLIHLISHNFNNDQKNKQFVRTIYRLNEQKTKNVFLFATPKTDSFSKIQQQLPYFLGCFLKWNKLFFCCLPNRSWGLFGILYCLYSWHGHSRAVLRSKRLSLKNSHWFDLNIIL